MLLVSSFSEAGVSVQHFFVATLAALDEAARSGAEYVDVSRGGYTLRGGTCTQTRSWAST